MDSYYSNLVSEYACPTKWLSLKIKKKLNRKHYFAIGDVRNTIYIIYINMCITLYNIYIIHIFCVRVCVCVNWEILHIEFSGILYNNTSF